ncbi:LUD domain-containing protein [Nocardioides sp. GCM10027113]|uniref:LUD domain-containing protein n=1 Tax=unclassified Nocardioides TaxID=2615069 RepID=UPI00361B373E
MTATSLLAQHDNPATKTVTALRRRGHEVHRVATVGAGADLALELLPDPADFFTASSETVRLAGLEDRLVAAGHRSVRQAFGSMDYERDRRRMKELAGAPSVLIGSVNAVTHDGEVLVASSSGSQLAGYSYGADRVIWLVGMQKLVPDLADGMLRIREHCLPLEDARARAAYGQGSAVNKVLTVFGEPTPGRTQIILIDEPVGY